MTLLHADTNAYNGGYLVGTGVFLILFMATVIVQILTAPHAGTERAQLPGG